MYGPDDILTLTELAAAFRLDPRTVKKVAHELGGKRFGRCLLFRWGTVMESFDANPSEGQRELLDGASCDRRKNSRHSLFSTGPQKGAGMDKRKSVGGGAQKRIAGSPEQKAGDPYGLRAALGLE